MKKRKVQNLQEESAIMNSKTYLQYYNRLVDLAISMFEWKNLPESVDPRFIEWCLFHDGMCVFFRDDVMGELALQCMIGGKLDVYRIPIERTAYASNGYRKKLDNTNSVIIYNNELHTNSLLDVEQYALRLYETERTIDVNLHAQKTPVLIQCSENQRLTMRNLYMQYDGNVPFIFGDKNLDLNSLKVMKTDAPFIADRLMQYKFQLWNEAMTYLGISNVNMHKKERLLNDEVTRNMGSTVAQRFTRLNARKQACAQINRMFGLEIDVDYREDVQVIADVVSEQETLQGEFDGVERG